MTRLNLSPFPSFRSGEVSGVSEIERDGFVDDAVVLALVSGSSSGREALATAELALAADHMDFAGWCLTPDRVSTRSAAPRREAAPPQPIRRPTPPVFSEPGIGEPHRGQHRWWLACLAGAVTALLFSMLLISLSTRIGVSHGGKVIVETLAKPKPVAPAEKPAPKQPAPQLTEVSP